MKFINEKVIEADAEIFGLREINIRELKGEGDYYWTINEERTIYFRYMGYDREKPGEIQYSFFWKGGLFAMRACPKTEGTRGGKGSTTWTHVALFPDNEVAQAALASSKAALFADLKQALNAHKDFGVFSAFVEHTAHFDF